MRKDISSESVCNRENLLALVTDMDLQLPGIPVLGLEEVCRCADLLEQEMHKKTER